MKLSRALLASLAVLVMAVGLLALPASAAKYDVTASIWTSRKTCEITGKAAWRMYDAQTVSVSIWQQSPYVKVAETVEPAPADRGRLSVSTIGTTGVTYQVYVAAYGSPGGTTTTDWTTLTC